MEIWIGECRTCNQLETAVHYLLGLLCTHIVHTFTLTLNADHHVCWWLTSAVWRLKVISYLLYLMSGYAFICWVHCGTYTHTFVLSYLQEATDEELDEAFYDHFTLTLSRLQVLLAGPKQDWTAAWSSASSPLHLLEPATLDLELRKSLLPNDTRLPK